MSTITKPEQDAGINYALVKEAKETAEKYNNSLKMIRAFTNRRAALNKAKKAGQDTANLSEKIEELEDSIDNAETEKAKALARLNKLQEGGVSVEEHLLTEKPGETQEEESWDMEEEPEQEVKEVNYYSYDQVNYGEAEQPGAAWGEPEPAGWQPSPPPEPQAEVSQALSQALVLYNFDATSSDELTVSEGEWVNLLVSQAQEEGWVMAENREGQTGLVPASFVTETTPEEYEASLAAQQVSAPVAPEQDWAAPALPSCPPPAVENSSEEEEEEEETTEDSEDDDDGPPPGLAPPPGPPPAVAPPPSPCAPPQLVAGKYKSVVPQFFQNKYYFFLFFCILLFFTSQTIICRLKRLRFYYLTTRAD